MVREIMRDEEFLKRPSTPATAADAQIADDLLDTLRANAGRCVGMAANMIGEAKCIIAFEGENGYAEMFNPKIIKQSGPFEAEEGCLSLNGARKTKRYREIKVQWQTRDMKQRIKNFSGFTAQIIQHEIDHLNGIII
ncbi:MAG: peptide deformylase [Clostridia bacterium]|nr:peptide deformylase [Clostridia bacterium]